ncbi:hypothetical protein H9L39_02202 [Fusarium oxysporum f. sp. albedinis]|nr:hypothetical protein H9L39_02202 [Fusarium oxysporum f. sp. albedinis]
MIFNGLPSIGETSLQFRLLYSESKTDNRCNTILGYTSSMLLSRAATLGEAEGPDDYLNEALSAWQPLSPSSTSTMEYLAAISFCSHSQLASIGKPHLLTLNERAMEGLLLSRRKQHDKAAKVLNKTVVDITSHYGLRSMQLGIVSAELANCYNVLRRESLAEATLTKPLEARLDSTLWRRCDGIYLRLAMADSFIGRARYQEAVPILQSVTDDPEISATFRMMSALRLTRSRRRMHDDAQKAFEQNSPLWTGLALLGNVPEVLVMEYVEELGCSISELPKRQLEDSKNTQELIEAVNSVLCRSRSPTDNPSWEWYSKLEKEYLGHITKDPKTNKGKEKSNRLQNEDENEMKTPILSQPFPPLRSRADNGMRDDDEGPWSEKLVLSFDAGGVHSISSLLILKQIMHRIRELELYHPHGPAYSSGSSYSWIRPENGIPKVLEDSERVDEFLPCHYFDYMIGSSTGCLNSIMLGRLRISVDQAIDNFIDFGNSTFGDPRVLHSGSALFLPRAKYSIVNAQMALEKIDDSILDFMDSEISCGSHGHGHRTRTMALSLCVKGDTTSDYIWRSYRGPSIATQGEYAMHASFLFSPISVLQVALATIATPPYFGLREINGHRFLDGGLVARDPSFIAVREIQHLHKKLPAILVSLGTGLVPVASDNDYKRPAILQTAGTWLLRYRSKTSTRTSPWESADTEEQTTRRYVQAPLRRLASGRDGPNNNTGDHRYHQQVSH